jgi:hypothetical protein
VIANIKARLKKLRRFSAPQRKRYFAGLTGLRPALRLRSGGAGSGVASSLSIWANEGVKRGLLPAIPSVGCLGIRQKGKLFWYIMGLKSGLAPQRAGRKFFTEPNGGRAYLNS